MKVFISQPMTGLTNEEILKVRNETITYLKDSFVFGVLPNEIEFIDSFIEDSNEKPLYLLGKALEKLSIADVCVFVDGWKDSRGCRIEHECCVQYGIPKIYFETLN